MLKLEATSKKPAAKKVLTPKFITQARQEGRSILEPENTTKRTRTRRSPTPEDLARNRAIEEERIRRRTKPSAKQVNPRTPKPTPPIPRAPGQVSLFEPAPTKKEKRMQIDDVPPWEREPVPAKPAPAAKKKTKAKATPAPAIPVGPRKKAEPNSCCSVCKVETIAAVNLATGTILNRWPGPNGEYTHSRECQKRAHKKAARSK